MATTSRRLIRAKAKFWAGDRYASLPDVPGPIEIVDIFREPAAVPAIVEEAIAEEPK